MEKTYVTAIIVAAGSSTRMGGHVSKQLMCILGKSVIIIAQKVPERYGVFDENMSFLIFFSTRSSRGIF